MPGVYWPLTCARAGVAINNSAATMINAKVRLFLISSFSFSKCFLGMLSFHPLLLAENARDSKCFTHEAYCRISHLVTVTSDRGMRFGSNRIGANSAARKPVVLVTTDDAQPCVNCPGHHL